jgi:hypothetical protein
MSYLKGLFDSTHGRGREEKNLIEGIVFSLRGVLRTHHLTHSFRHTHTYKAMSSLILILVLGYRYEFLGQIFYLFI